MDETLLLSVSDFVALTNQTLEYAYPSVSLVGEVSEYKVIQGKWVSFKLKDDGAVVSCFGSVFQLRTPVQDGMKIIVVAQPRLNQKGYFTLNIRSMKPLGEGSIKKGFELLKAKLEAEGLFAPERKRTLPRVPQRVAVITSTESAAYADFTRIINERWGGLSVSVAHTQVQGDPAADQIIRAINYFNGQETLPEVLIIIRGGGSAEDLSTFNDEPLARAIATSRIPTLVGVGHEIDHSLADMVADVRAATPTHAAETLVPDRQEIIRATRSQVAATGNIVLRAIEQHHLRIKESLKDALQKTQEQLQRYEERVKGVRSVLEELDPQTVLRRGYALLRGSPVVGETLEIELATKILTTEVQDVRQK
jgi:exodeoxyribonuclease VII large subunit